MTDFVPFFLRAWANNSLIIDHCLTKSKLALFWFLDSASRLTCQTASITTAAIHVQLSVRFLDIELFIQCHSDWTRRCLWIKETRYDEKWVRYGSRLPASFLCVRVQGITFGASLYLCMVLDARGLPEAAFGSVYVLGICSGVKVQSLYSRRL